MIRHNFLLSSTFTRQDALYWIFLEHRLNITLQDGANQTWHRMEQLCTISAAAQECMRQTMCVPQQNPVLRGFRCMKVSANMLRISSVLSQDFPHLQKWTNTDDHHEVISRFFGSRSDGHVREKQVTDQNLYMQSIPERSALTSRQTATDSGTNRYPEQHSHMKHVSNLSEPSIADISHAIASAKSLRDVEAVLLMYGRAFRSCHVVQLLTVLPAVELVGVNSDPRLKQITRLMCEGLADVVEELDGPALSACTWALGRLGQAPPGALHVLLDALLADGDLRMSRCSFSQLADVAWSMSRLQVLHGEASRLLLPQHQNSQLSAATEGPLQVENSSHHQDASRLPDSTSTHSLAESSRLSSQVGLAEVYSPHLNHDKNTAGIKNVTISAVHLRAWKAIARLAVHRIEHTTGDDISRMAWSFAKAQTEGHLKGLSGSNHLTSLLTSIAQCTVQLCLKYPPAESPSIDGLRGVTARHNSALMSRQKQAMALKGTQEDLNSGRRKLKMGHDWLSGGVDGGVEHQVGKKTSDSLGRRLHLEDGEKGELEPGNMNHLSTLKPLEVQEVRMRARNVGLSSQVMETGKKLSPQEKGLSPSNITNLAWAYAVLGHRDNKFLAALAKAAVPQKAYFDPAGLSSLAWAFAAFGVHDEPLFTAIAIKACRRIRHFTSEQMSMLYWGMASVGHYDASLMERLRAGVHHLVTTVGINLTAREAANLLWSFTQLQPQPIKRTSPKYVSDTGSPLPLLIQQLLKHLPQEDSRNSTQSGMQLGASSPKAGSTKLAAFDPLADQRSDEDVFASSFSATDLTNVLWSIAVVAALRPTSLGAALLKNERRLLRQMEGLRGHESTAYLDSTETNDQGRHSNNTSSSIWDLLPGLLSILRSNRFSASEFNSHDLERLHRADLIFRAARWELEAGRRQFLSGLVNREDQSAAQVMKAMREALALSAAASTVHTAHMSSDVSTGHIVCHSSEGDTVQAPVTNSWDHEQTGTCLKSSLQQIRQEDGSGTLNPAILTGLASECDQSSFGQVQEVAGRRVVDVSHFSFRSSFKRTSSGSCSPRRTKKSVGGSLDITSVTKVSDVSCMDIEGTIPHSSPATAGLSPVLHWWEDPFESFLGEDLSRKAAAAARERASDRIPSMDMRRGKAGMAWMHEVYMALEELGCQPTEGIPVLGGAAVVDVAVMDTSLSLIGSKRLAVQRCGKNMYSRNPPHNELGESILERRLLQLGGWRVVSVSFHQWGLWEGAEEQLMYLSSRLLSLNEESIPVSKK
ncbi:hypothetical protein CEUSTIGMA_g4734.t1 [Chlamydomonas eustigma]|uniref:RAP domain-containing protein n=1 Tax=Chlamydomonas eustigma TaxID=1157962 RepID=A0A250X2J3_9CHLO|nr:hypothetical protein CEUSTIGMA_g4734.t1 [Chlamydomonas eustigma]|eukprot:GAX77288.1 hypothetical protein CEUSTIGMA_g4734.t1 [Chlamydomonas eustigma]